ncbi:hypothetical protein [Salinarimonas sp.]|uniref:hypothetical protein n=1 Tax=Salinarimonas sp. TaxID=2766526 RepID=UPI003919FAF3
MATASEVDERTESARNGLQAAALLVLCLSLALCVGLVAAHETRVFRDGVGSDVSRYLGLDGTPVQVRSTGRLPGYAACAAQAARVPTEDHAAYAAALGSCADILRASLARAPHDADAWTALAQTLIRAEGLSEPALAALSRSYETARAELWITARRLPLALILWDALPETLREAARGEILAISRSRFGLRTLADIYMTLPGRARPLVVSALEGEPQEIQRAFLTEVRRRVRTERAGGS